MSQENVELVRAAVRAFGARDPERWVNCFHPNVEFLLPRNVLEGGSYRGHEGVRRALADAYETWEDIRFEIQEVRALNDGAVILGRTVNVGKGDAPAVEYQSAYLAKLRDGKIAYWRPYQSHAAALEAVGLSEQDAHANS
jgi:ketosteroid isomerase-like protein